MPAARMRTSALYGLTAVELVASRTHCGVLGFVVDEPNQSPMGGGDHKYRLSAMA